MRRTIERLRTQKAFRRPLGGAQNVGSDSDLSQMGVQNVVNGQIQSDPMFAPVVSVVNGSKDFQSRDVGTLTGQSMSVINDAIQRGSLNVRVVSVINVAEQRGTMRSPVDLVMNNAIQRGAMLAPAESVIATDASA